MKFPARSLTGILAVILFTVMARTAHSAESELGPPKLKILYGNNAVAGTNINVNGIKLYVETYGSGQPMLQIHGNGDDISAMGYQIEFFASHYKVIAPDSRGHGKSELGTSHLTYEQMAEDMNALLEKLGLKDVYVLGWSDGGIIGLLLAMHHPDKVSKLAIMGANLYPEGAYDWAFPPAIQRDRFAATMISRGDTSQPWPLIRQQLDLVLNQPHIPVADLAKVKAPTLVMAGDKDVIRDEHTLEIFHGLPQAQLAIFPGATHLVPWQNHELFNQTVERFFAQPFVRPDTKNYFK